MEIEYKLCQVEVSSPSYRQEHIVYLVLTYTCQYLGRAREIVEKGRLKLQSLPHYLVASKQAQLVIQEESIFLLDSQLPDCVLGIFLSTGSLHLLTAIGTGY